MSQLRGGAPVPQSVFPILPLRTGVLFPGTVITLPVGRKRSVALVESLHSGDIVGVVTQKDPKVTDPTGSDLHTVGTYVRVLETVRLANGEYRLSLEGLGRMTLTNVHPGGLYWKGEGTVPVEQGENSEE